MNYKRHSTKIWMIAITVWVVILSATLYKPIPDGVLEPWKARQAVGLLRFIGAVAYVSQFIGLGSFISNTRIIVDTLSLIPPKYYDGIQVEDSNFGGTKVRLYVPTVADDRKAGILFVHGGGWLICSVETHDHIVSEISRRLNVMVVSVDYHLCPENPYPVPLQDTLNAHLHFIKNADVYGVDPNRIAIVGDSAGGNMAAALTQKLRDSSSSLPQPKLQALVYPTLQAVDFKLSSYIQNEDAVIGTAEDTALVLLSYMGVDMKYAPVMAQNNHTDTEVQDAFIDLVGKYLPPEMQSTKQSRSLGRASSASNELTEMLKPYLLDPFCFPLMQRNLTACREKNQILWKNKEANTYYMCYEEKEALQMTCPAGSYMCKQPNTAFKPCDCNKEKFIKLTGIFPPNSIETEPYESRGCRFGDEFEVFPGKHMFDGKREENTPLRKCMDMCLDSTECIGVDYENSTVTCYLLNNSSLQYEGLGDSKIADHYRKCLIHSKSAFDKFGKQVTGSVTTGLAATGAAATAAAATTAAATAGATAAATTVAGATTMVTVTPTTATTTTTAAPTTTIPDSGCPFSLQKTIGMSHPFGKNITNGTLYNTKESCKRYCLYNSPCKGVDFDNATGTCYELRAVNSNLLTANPSVWHFMKTSCPPPLKCYVAAVAPVNSSTIAIQTPGATQTICNGMCFTREVMQQGVTTVERGCMTGTGLQVGCMVGMSGTAPTDLTTMTCLCDRERCNGLSAMASAALAAYYPLDGDLNDSSGLGHNGMAVDPNNPPQFSLMDRAVNTSAVFTGTQCIKIPSLTDVEYGAINGNQISPQVSFTFWYKRLADGSNTREGIFGNSLLSDPTSDATADPANVASVRLIASQTEGFVEAGVRTLASTNRLDPAADIQDFRFRTSPVNEWNLACLTYDGRNVASMNLVPTLTLNISTTSSSTPVSTGTTNSDEGLLQNVQKQPVVIGCAQNLPFTGFIDEVRIFMTTLMPEDCQALRVMNDIFC